MSLDLFTLAEQEQVPIEYFNFKTPVYGCYFADPIMRTPVIGIGKHIENRNSILRCVLAEELGHHFTTVGDHIPQKGCSSSRKLEINKAEYKAMKWAAQYLTPRDRLYNAMKHGIVNVWELVEHFDVTEEMIRFRFQLPDLRTA